MAKASVTCTCENCGEQFVKEEYRQNRKMADEWAEWAKDNFTLCPKCYRERIKKDNAKKAEVYNLLQLSGTEKQVAYALDLRNKWAAKSAETIKLYLKMRDAVSKAPEKADKLINDEMPTRDAVIAAAFKAYGLQDAHTIFTCSDAHAIIDLLK